MDALSYTYIYISFLFSFCFYLLIIWHSFLCFLIKYEILLTYFARAEFECTFSFVSLLFISLLWLFLRAEEVYTVWLWTMRKWWLYKETIKCNSLGIVPDHCDCHNTRILRYLVLCGKIMQMSYHLESNAYILAFFLFIELPCKKKRKKNHKSKKKKKKCTGPDLNGELSITSPEVYH